MCPLLETLRFEDGEFNNIEYHIRRMKQSAKVLFKTSLIFEPEQVLKEARQKAKNKDGLFKFRLEYGLDEFLWEFVPYSLPNIKTLKLIYSDAIDYSLKYSDRSKLNFLRGRKGDADDILIVKNNEITDTSFANILFYDGNQWLTPKNPLLHGTQRAFLLERNYISKAIIRVDDLFRFQKSRIVNAMIRFEDELDMEIIS